MNVLISPDYIDTEFMLLEFMMMSFTFNSYDNFLLKEPSFSSNMMEKHY